VSSNDGTWRDHRDELFDRVVKRGQARKRRRGLAVSGALLVVVVAVTAGLLLPDRGRDTLRVAPPDKESTTTVDPARPGNVLLIGDSVMLGARQSLGSEIPNVYVDAKVSRQFWDATAVLGFYKTNKLLPPTIVIHLGTNGQFAEAQFQQLMDTVGSESQVYFLTAKLPRPWEAVVNNTLSSEAKSFPNAHVLEWHDFSSPHADWFLADGFHLSPAGQAAYAGFIRDGIRAPVTTFRDPFADRVVPASGFVLTDNAKQEAEREPSTFDIELLDASGQEIATLPRAAIENVVLNAPQHVLVLTDSGIHLEPASFAAAADLPSGCTPAERSEELAVAVCGPGSGINVLGDRIVVDNGTGWRQVIGRPPAPPGVTTVGGHWAWASASPDGRWVAAQWSGECEVPIGFIVSTADGSLRTITGEAGAGWGDAPNSGVIGWAADGSAMGLFGGESGCGRSSPAQRGVYLVSPDTGARRLLVALTPTQGILTWSSIDDRRTGKHDPDAEAGITYAFAHFFDPALTADERAALIQSSAAMRASIDEAFSRHAGEVAAGAIIVDKVTVHGAAADVSFHAQLGGKESPANPGQINGTAMLEDGTWKISRATYCTLSANDGEPCPPE
jgi:hypothetical protein